MKHQGTKPVAQTRTSGIFKWIAYGGLILIGVCVAILLYWLYQPSEVLHFKQTPIPVRTIRDHPTANGVVILKVDYCKKVEAVGRVRTSFISSSREILLPPAEDKQPKQCIDTELPILIPKDLPPDTYKIHFRVDYKINPFKNTTEEIDSKEFEVVEM